MLTLLLVLSCTQDRASHSPTEEEQQSDTASPLLVAGPAREVVDPLGRWVSVLEGPSAPQLKDEAGFVQLVLPSPPGVSLSCFVYEMSLDTGQAVLRFLRAVSVGIRFRSFELETVEVQNGAPVLHFAGAYEAEVLGGRGGVLSMIISPRIQFPVMCTHDGPKSDPAFATVVTGFLKAFRLRKPVERKLLLSEIWELKSEQKTIGFSWFQSYQGEEQVVSNLSLASSFVWANGKGRTTDFAAVEIEDEGGVSQGRWLSSRGTQKLVELSLKRHSVGAGAVRYRFLGELDGREIAGDFVTQEALRSSRYLDGALRLLGQDDSLKEQQWLQYVPELDSSGATMVRLARHDADGLLLERGSSSMMLELGPEHRPVRKVSRAPASGQREAAPPVEARLLERRPVARP